jgi:capsule polysaccharide export protein KpsE/RkpR
MSSTRTSSFRRVALDHFEPEVDVDHQTQRRLRGQLEQIDYTVFASNREVISAVLGHTDAAKFQRLAVAAALARAQWIAEALRTSENAHVLTAEEVSKLARMRAGYEELSEAYEAMRRMVERGYIPFRPAPPTK